MIPTRNNAAGFTLIELLVVIAIISALSSVAFAAVNRARKKAQTQVAEANMNTFAHILGYAQGESGKTLLTMSTQAGASMPNCSACVTACDNPNQLKNVPSTNACYIEWTIVLGAVKSNAAQLGDNITTTMLRDPWGSPYLIDQNQGEPLWGCTSTPDSIMSVGPDGLNGTGDDINGPDLPLSPTCP